MSCAITASLGQKDRPLNPPAPIWVRRCVITTLVSTLMNLKLLTAELQHLGHEGHALELTRRIKSPKDLFPAQYFHPITDFVSSFSLHPSVVPYRIDRTSLVAP